jgi:hypothetical protein
MDGIDELAQSMLARCASHGYSVAEVEDRHAQGRCAPSCAASPASGGCGSVPLCATTASA